MDSVNIYEAKTTLSKLVARAEAGEEILISRNGTPVAKLTPLSPPLPRRQLGLLKGQIVLHPGWDEFTEQDEKDWYGE